MSKFYLLPIFPLLIFPLTPQDGMGPPLLELGRGLAHGTHVGAQRASQTHHGYTQRLVLTPEVCTERPAEQWVRGRTAKSGVHRGPAGNANVWHHLGI